MSDVLMTFTLCHFFLFIRTLLSSRIYGRMLCLFARSHAHLLFGSVSWTVGCSLAAMILITLSLLTYYVNDLYLIQIKTVSSIC